MTGSEMRNSDPDKRTARCRDLQHQPNAQIGQTRGHDPACGTDRGGNDTENTGPYGPLHRQSETERKHRYDHDAAAHSRQGTQSTGDQSDYDQKAYVQVTHLPVASRILREDS